MYRVTLLQLHCRYVFKREREREREFIYLRTRFIETKFQLMPDRLNSRRTKPRKLLLFERGSERDLVIRIIRL